MDSPQTAKLAANNMVNFSQFLTEALGEVLADAVRDSARWLENRWLENRSLVQASVQFTKTNTSE
ncbi:hypothetical protein SH449x_001585 [Pirellulaceae bacterium SH449]